MNIIDNTNPSFFNDEASCDSIELDSRSSSDNQQVGRGGSGLSSRCKSSPLLDIDVVDKTPSIPRVGSATSSLISLPLKQTIDLLDQTSISTAYAAEAVNHHLDTLFKSPFSESVHQADESDQKRGGQQESSIIKRLAEQSHAIAQASQSGELESIVNTVSDLFVKQLQPVINNREKLDYCRQGGRYREYLLKHTADPKAIKQLLKETVALFSLLIQALIAVVTVSVTRLNRAVFVEWSTYSVKRW